MSELATIHGVIDDLPRPYAKLADPLHSRPETPHQSSVISGTRPAFFTARIRGLACPAWDDLVSICAAEVPRERFANRNNICYLVIHARIDEYLVCMMAKMGTASTLPTRSDDGTVSSPNLRLLDGRVTVAGASMSIQTFADVYEYGELAAYMDELSSAEQIVRVAIDFATNAVPTLEFETIQFLFTRIDEVLHARIFRYLALSGHVGPLCIISQSGLDVEPLDIAIAWRWAEFDAQCAPDLSDCALERDDVGKLVKLCKNRGQFAREIGISHRTFMKLHFSE